MEYWCCLYYASNLDFADIEYNTGETDGAKDVAQLQVNLILLPPIAEHETQLVSKG